MNKTTRNVSCFTRRALTLAVAAGLSAGVVTNSHAELTGFYEGETLEILTPWTPGGGADTWGRYVAATIGPF